MACKKTKPLTDFPVTGDAKSRRLKCAACADYKKVRMERVMAAIDALPAPLPDGSSLSAALEQGAAEAIAYLRAMVERGHKALAMQKHDQRTFTTITTCATTAAKALAMLQLRVNEAAWRTGGSADVLGDILRRVEETEQRLPPPAAMIEGNS